jgi:Uma2 family endonuclease
LFARKNQSQLETEPDISAVEGTYDDFGDKHPATAAFVVEVALSSYEDDLYKANIYAKANIATYWILDIIKSKFFKIQLAANIHCIQLMV